MVTSDAQSHAWNALELEGDWYEADVTWDCPGYAPAGKGAPLGYCTYDYCFIPDSIMRDDHYGHNFTAADGMACNYYIKSGAAAAWVSFLEPRIADALQGSGRVSLAGLPGPAAREIIRREMITYCINSQDEIELSSGVWDLSVLYGWSDIIYVTGSRICGKPMTIPDGITAIEAEAFAKASAEYIRLPRSLKTIGARAFMNSTMTRIYIPQSVTSIDASAFTGCSSKLLVLVDGPDTVAARFADAHGYATKVIH
ncbi:MAG: leucine-rich repeat protein [Clostridia bacterium]|nr:leucine-rich repeat protein [Clostridia bacterium]